LSSQVIQSETCSSTVNSIKEILREAFQWLDQCTNEELSNPLWTVTKKCPDVIIKQAYRQGKGSETPCYQVRGELPATPNCLLNEIVLPPEKIRRWSSVVDVQIIETVEGDNDSADTEDEKIPIYQIYRQVHAPALGGLVSPRDFALCRSWRYNELNQTFQFVCVSVDHEKVPIQNGFVRGMLYFSGWTATPLPSDCSGCLARYFVQVNIMGSLPSWIVNKAMIVELSESFSKIRKLLL